MARKDDTAICYVGMPRVRPSGIDILSFHVHRYVFGWLRLHRRDSVLITVGFEKSTCESVTLVVRDDSARVVEAGWCFGDLLELWQSGSTQLRLEPLGDGGDFVAYDLVPVFDEMLGDDLERDGAGPGILGFALLLKIDELSTQAVQRLQLPVGEAIRAARRNGLRMFMETNNVEEMKTFLYGFMDRLPEWTGCDYASSFLLASNLETMTAMDGNQASRERLEDAYLDVLAERLYVDPSDGQTERLVGMSVCLGDDEGGIFRAVMERHRGLPQSVFHVLLRESDSEDGTSGGWRLSGDDNDGAEPSFHSIVSRGDEQMMVLLPLIVEDNDESELLGFVCLVYREQMKILSSFARLASEIRQQLSSALRYSPLYTLRARKLSVLRRLRGVLENEIVQENGDRDVRHTELIAKVSELLVREVEIPSFAIGYIRDEGADAGRVLCYAHPHGWSRPQDITLAIDVAAGERVDSGISTLAIRLGRPLVLAGGHGQGGALEFRNYLYVHEESGRLLDVRGVHAQEVLGDSFENIASQEARGWVRLSKYYRPARESAYATLAFPLQFAGTALGVLTLEVEKDTDWLWWTGFGSKFFWELVVADLSWAFYELQKP